MPAMSSMTLSWTALSRAHAAPRSSKVSGSTASVKRPVSTSTTRAVIASNCSSISTPGCNMPPADKMLRFLSWRMLACCMGFSRTAAPDTNTEQTTHSVNATVNVFLMVSLLATCEPPLDVCLYHEVVDKRREQVGEQDRQHHAFREGGIDDTDQHDHEAYQDAEEPLAHIGHGGGHRIGRHEHHAERKTAGDQVPVPGHCRHRVAVGTHGV